MQKSRKRKNKEREQEPPPRPKNSDLAHIHTTNEPDWDGSEKRWTTLLGEGGAHTKVLEKTCFFLVR